MSTTDDIEITLEKVNKQHEIEKQKEQEKVEIEKAKEEGKKEAAGNI